MKSLERLQDLFGKPAHAYRATTESFADIDVQRVASVLDLKKKGEKRGADNLPAADVTALDSVELEVIEFVSSAQKQSHDQLENNLSV